MSESRLKSTIVTEEHLKKGKKGKPLNMKTPQWWLDSYAKPGDKLVMFLVDDGLLIKIQKVAV